MEQPNKYYRDQVNSIQPGKVGTYQAQVKIKHETGETKWLSLNNDSAPVLAEFLQTNYELPPVKTHVLKVSPIGWTEKKPERIKIKSDLFEQSVIFNRDQANKVYDNLRSEAIAWLKARGFNVLSYGEGDNNSTYIISDTFKPLKDGKVS